MMLEVTFDCASVDINTCREKTRDKIALLIYVDILLRLKRNYMRDLCGCARLRSC